MSVETDGGNVATGQLMQA